jgi:kumamolisin
MGLFTPKYRQAPEHERSSYIRRPRASATGYAARDVARAYGCPIDAADGTGLTIGVIELGGAYTASDLAALGLPTVNITTVNVAGGKPVSDGPNGADGEVALDVQVIARVAPGAKQRVYFCPNTDGGFIAGVQQAITDGVDFISISWGGPESSWDPSTVQQFAAVFAAAKAKGITTFVAAGDAGSTDGTRTNTADYPASDPSVVGCGGTRLVLDSTGARTSEVVWDDNPRNDATGGGVSKFFAGRTVPDVAGNADPVTGYAVVIDGQGAVIGGTSAVAPLYAAMSAVVKQLHGSAFDFTAVVAANPTICFDVTSGNNGGYKAGPGRDNVSGWGVVDFGKLLAVLGSGANPVPNPNPTPGPDVNADDVKLAAALQMWMTAKGFVTQPHNHRLRVK